ncbi:FAD-dependent oxidoreductase [Desulfogranum mediterraneum]|uniref:FAD-dependent oxidoreductase n=1 Tax=Desulfogranum mediterraneum TaxID=160661 RepID=UPI00041BF0BB|nr:FAD-binding protein [Desulfogranum mediterraneum]
MGYTPELKELIKKVEATRPERVAKARREEHYPALSMDGRREVLSKFHPDYQEDAKREVKVGPNKGDVFQEGVTALLESRSVVRPDKVDLGKVDMETDVLVIGGGGAGTSAAIMAADAGCKVIIANKLRHGDSNTIMAEGGIQAATQECDSPYYHFLDTIGGGHFSNQRDLVAALAKDAPLSIAWLEKLGMMFNKYEDGRTVVRHCGGSSRKRLQSAGDMTGAEIMRVVRDEARNRAEMISVIEFNPAVELLLDSEGKCAGAILFNMETHEFTIVKAKAVVMSTGGFGRLHIKGFATTNHYGATMDGVVMAYRAGVGNKSLHSTQYHPTGVSYPEQNVGLLITEKVRGLGAHVLNSDGEQFCFPLEPRDVESAELIQEAMAKGKGIMTPTGRVGLWLDSPMIEELHGAGTVKKELPAKFIQFERHGIDISKEPMLVYPTLHYQNGGINVDGDTNTVLPGLFGAGEVIGGVHGENRLMGNSLQDIITFGRRAGINAAEYIKGGVEIKELSLDHVIKFEQDLQEAGIEKPKVAPILLPDYSTDEVAERRWPEALTEGTPGL